MAGTGLPTPAPTQAVQPAQIAAPASPVSTGIATIAGSVRMQSVASMQNEKRKSEEALQEKQSQPVIVGLASHIKGFFTLAEEAKRDVKDDMLEALYARRGQYTAAKLQQIQANGQPVIYMMLPSVKMRQAEALLRDVLIGSGTEKPWTLQPPAEPEMPPFVTTQITEAVTQQVQQLLASGQDPSTDNIQQMLQAQKEEIVNALREAGQQAAERAERKMETQLDEGNFNDALDQFITDLTTFRTAFIAGPTVRNKPVLDWGTGGTPTAKPSLVLEWDRVDPFDVYPAPWAKNLQDGTPLIIKHRLSRQMIADLRGTEGYDDDALKSVLDLYGTSGLTDWLSVDSEVAMAEGKTTVSAATRTSLIDALQYYGSVSGKMLRDWGMTPKEVPDETKEYQVEAWLVGHIVIKAVLNPDPLARRPLYGDSFERIPGSVWGHSVYDLMKDCADMCNAAARAMAANMGISSGPQVGVNVSRLPAGEDITAMHPWKVWQFEEDPMGSTLQPITFFQPKSNVQELQQVYDHFSNLADEYTGIPKYMTGTEGTPGAGRTASGLSMMIGNASKIIKQVVGSIDKHIIEPILERLYYYNLRYSQDPELKVGSLRIVARGAMSLTTKEAAQQRRSEFLQATNNPTDVQIMGMDGRAEVLRAAASTLDLNVDKVVPSPAIVKAKAAAQQAIQNAQALQGGSSPPGGSPPGGPSPPGGTPAGPSPSGQSLTNGAPVTDQFSPPKQ